MKKISVLLSSVVFSCTAMAADSYLEGQLGMTHYAIDKHSFSDYEVGVDQNAFAGSLRLGYNFAPENAKVTFGIETGLDILSAAQVGGLEVRQIAIDLLGVVGLNLTDSAYLFLKAGPARVHQYYNADNADLYNNAFQGKMVAGAGYRLNEDWDITGSLTHITGEKMFSDLDGYVSNTANTTTVSIGLKRYIG